MTNSHQQKISPDKLNYCENRGEMLWIQVWQKWVSLAVSTPVHHTVSVSQVPASLSSSLVGDLTPSGHNPL